MRRNMPRIIQNGTVRGSLSKELSFGDRSDIVLSLGLIKDGKNKEVRVGGIFLARY